jgi:hypothetical protein
MMIHFSDEVRIRFAGVILNRKHNTMSPDFFNVVSTALAQGLQSAVSYAYTPSLQMPTQIYVVFVNDGITEYVAPIQLQSASSNSVVLNYYDDSSNTYAFDTVQLWAGDNEVLYYPIAYTTLDQQLQKTSSGFLEITWTISWIPASVFVNIPSQLYSKAPVPVYQPLSGCTQPFVSALIMALMGIPVSSLASPQANNGACAYLTLGGALQAFGINGVSYVVFYDSNYNMIGYAKGPTGVITFSTTPSYVLVLESAGSVQLPLFGGAVSLPVNTNNAYVVSVSFTLTQGVSASSSGVSSSGTSTTTGTSGTGGGSCTSLGDRILHVICI